MTRQPPADPFEDDIRRALADEARQPAPERLAARVAAISSQRPPSRWSLGRLGRRRAGGPLLVLAAAAVVLLAVLALGPSPWGGPVGPGGAPTPSPAPAATPPAATPVASPGETPGPVTPVPSPTGQPVAAGFAPRSVTFVSADLGWALGSVPCAGGTCPAIARTTDGGRTWSAGPAVPNAVAGAIPAGPCVLCGLRFADERDGWIFGSDLWATHDGGTTWQQASIAGLSGGTSTVMAVEAAGGLVHAAVFDGQAAVMRIASSPVGEDAWTVSGTTVQVGAGPVPATQVVLHGSVGWLVQVDRTVVDGARLVAGAWQAWRPPCLDSNGPAWLAATSSSDLVAACDVGLWSNPAGVRLFTSNDGGTTFHEVGGLVGRPPVAGLAGVAAPAGGSVVLSGEQGGAAALVASFDGGKTWTTVLSAPGASLSELGFTTAEQGVVIATDAAGSHLLMTRDGGRTWSGALGGG